MAVSPWLEAAEYDMGGFGAAETCSSGTTCDTGTDVPIADGELITAEVEGLVIPTWPAALVVVVWISTEGIFATGFLVLGICSTGAGPDDRDGIGLLLNKLAHELELGGTTGAVTGAVGSAVCVD